MAAHLRDLDHVRELAEAAGHQVERLGHAGDESHEPGGICVSPCPACGGKWDAIFKSLKGGGVAVTCNGCRDDLAAMTDALLKPSGATKRRLRLRPLAGRLRRRVEFLFGWVRFPRGHLSVIVGLQGDGKSLLTMLLAAEATRRGVGVVFLADEDAVESVILPRAEAAGADLSLIFTPETIRDDDAGVILPKDTGELVTLFKEHNISLLILDPWTNHVGVDLDSGKVRHALAPLARLAKQHGVTVIIVAHPTKRDGAEPLAQIAHASAVSQIARSAYFLTVDPTQGTLSQRDNPYRLLSHIKNNLTERGPTVRLRIEPVKLPADGPQPEMIVPRLVREAEDVDLTYEEIRALIQQLRGGTDATVPRSNPVDEAERWLADRLADGAAHDRNTLLAEAEDAGHAKRTIQRAFGRLGVVSKDGTWRLPSRHDAPSENGGATGAGGADDAAEPIPAPPAPPAPPLLHDETWRGPEQTKGLDPDDVRQPE
jgi:hypothetical protein